MKIDIKWLLLAVVLMSVLNSVVVVAVRPAPAQEPKAPRSASAPRAHTAANPGVSK